MNEELQKLTVDALKELGSWIQSLKNFTVEQTPLFVQEYASWYIWSHALDFFFYAILTACVFWVGTKYLGRQLRVAQEESDQDAMGVFWLARLLSLGVLFGNAVSHLQETGKGIFAPRLVIVEGIMSLAKTGQASQAGK